jgi:hypothetical protein
MTEKKDPQQGSTKIDLFAEDDDIIDLTEEVKTTSADDADIVELKPTASASTGKIRPPLEPPASAIQAKTSYPEDDDVFTEEDEDIIASAIDRFGKAEVDDDTMAPDDEFEFEFDDDDDHFMGEDQPADGKDEFVDLGDDESMEMLEEEDAFDFEEELDLKFESDEEASVGIDVSKDDTEKEVDTTPGVVGEVPASMEDDGRHQPAGDVSREAETAMDIFALTEEESREPELQADALEFETAIKSLDDEGLDLTALIADQEEDDDRAPALADESAAPIASADDEIVEITEFDQHFAGEPYKLSETASVLDESKLEEDEFLEAVEIEEESLADEKRGALHASEVQTPDAKMSPLFSDTAPEQIEPVGRPAENFARAPVMDMAAATAEIAAEPEKFSFDMETKEISAQIDRLDAFLAEESALEPAVAFLPDEQSKQDERPAEGIQKSALTDAVMDLTPERLDTAIARLIDEKFSAKIESIIYEVIERAVTKEIDRLKGFLLENDGYPDRH